MTFFFVYRFQKACVKYGVPDVDLFQTTDLYDMKNIALVTQTIFAVGRAVSLLFFKLKQSRVEVTRFCQAMEGSIQKRCGMD